jgi:hypothetical protein
VILIETPITNSPYDGELSVEFPRANSRARGGILADAMVSVGAGATVGEEYSEITSSFTLFESRTGNGENMASTTCGSK